MNGRSGGHGHPLSLLSGQDCEWCELQKLQTVVGRAGKAQEETGGGPGNKAGWTQQNIDLCGLSGIHARLS